MDLSLDVQSLLSWELVLRLFVKPGKLPREVISADYEKEYGVDTLTMHADAIKPGQRVLIVDDLLATCQVYEQAQNQFPTQKRLDIQR